MAYSRRELRWFLRLPGAKSASRNQKEPLRDSILTACFEAHRTHHHHRRARGIPARRSRHGTADAAEKSLAQRGASEIELETAVDNDAAIAILATQRLSYARHTQELLSGRPGAYAMMKRIPT